MTKKFSDATLFIIIINFVMSFSIYLLWLNNVNYLIKIFLTIWIIILLIFLDYGAIKLFKNL
jgi:hypothetical protein